jgi:hypothetical protein
VVGTKNVEGPFQKTKHNLAQDFAAMLTAILPLAGAPLGAGAGAVVLLGGTPPAPSASASSSGVGSGEGATSGATTGAGTSDGVANGTGTGDGFGVGTTTLSDDLGT